MDTRDHDFAGFYNAVVPPPTPPEPGEVTVDSFSLKCQQLADEAMLIASDFDEWQNGQVMKTRKVYGAKGVWKLSLFEHDVVWAASAAKYLRDKVKSGGTVDLAVDAGGKFTLDSTTCYVLGCQTSLLLKGKVNVHYFTATFREV
jgi:hypothetical protein